MNKRILFTLILPAVILTAGFAQDKLYPNTFSLQDVRITSGPFRHACELNTDVLLQYDADRFLAPFMREAGLASKKESYGNWEKDGLDGHVGGHYLTALAIHYAAGGSAECKERMDYMVAELKRVQDANGDGSISGFPKSKSFWEEIRKGNVGIVWRYWVPWYNVHKTFAGLRDAWLYGGNEQARTMFLDICDWGVGIISHLDDRQMEAMLANEFGGMNEVYADAYQMTANPKYLDAAKRFSHKEIFDSMAAQKDNLDNKHANTQVPKAVGYQRVAELSGDAAYVTASRFFWETVAVNRSLSLGGNSRSEHFPEAQRCFEYMDERQGPESCNTNNMLKLAEGLFRMNPDARYADYYERAMFNHILSTQHPGHGGYVYFTPARPGHYRVYSAPNQAMWCCVGTGMENHGKYGEFIYTHQHDSLFVNLFVPSELNWKDKKTVIVQQTGFPNEEGSTLIVNPRKASRFKIFIRHPWWVAAEDMQVICGGTDYARGSTPSSYIEIDRKWKKGDVIEIRTPMKVAIEELPNVPKAISIMRGPILLAAKTSTRDMPGLIAGDGRWEHIAHGPLMSLFDAPYILGERTEILAKLNRMKPVTGKPFTFTVPGLFVQDEYKNLELEPFYGIHDSRYMMYWLSMTEDEFRVYSNEAGAAERDKLILDKRTVDRVSAGEQQPEADHGMQVQHSSTGTHEGEAWREAGEDGYFQYTLATGKMDDLSLMIRYRADETGNQKFDILMDGELLKHENTAGKWNRPGFVDEEYRIPAKFLRGKERITVRFQPQAENKTASIFAVRLLKPRMAVILD
ncbi:beta-L-arabinofuranosidase domain-containing protein [Bacteroides sp. 51]|uniref:glycoside hydrolase family 127 protein n=1 Tax=Bacteroides sp. 51 TaxID=2302938 RepID=UPI0013CFE443|nr:beta-L-arabinofuranosidase domain-containing protein [Bacteroides sp. 51]NDV81582.1 hypothetical protein [Bacteroides sp. 51]